VLNNTCLNQNLFKTITFENNFYYFDVSDHLPISYINLLLTQSILLNKTYFPNIVSVQLKLKGNEKN